MSKLKQEVYVIITVVVLILLGGTGGRNLRAATGQRVIEITAKRFQFTPDLVIIKKGETVTLRLHSNDVTHGFFMRALKIDEVIEPGQVAEVTVTPQVAGKFTTICDHFCGANHGNMKLTILVEE